MTHVADRMSLLDIGARLGLCVLVGLVCVWLTG